MILCLILSKLANLKKALFSGIQLVGTVQVIVKIGKKIFLLQYALERTVEKWVIDKI